MQVRLHNTSKVVELEIGGHQVPARVWEGTTDAGVPVIAWITRIAVPLDQDQTEFQRDLAEQRPPSPAAEAFPVRMIL